MVRLGCDWMGICMFLGRDEETYPAFVADALWTFATDAHTDNVCGRVEKAIAEVDELLVTHLLAQRVDGHGANQLLILDCGAIFQEHFLDVRIDLVDGAVRAKPCIFLRKRLGHCLPDAPCAIVCWKAEGGVGAPVAGCFLEDDVFGDGFDVWGSYTLAKPLALHLHRISPLHTESFHVWSGGENVYEGDSVPLLLAQPRL